MPNLHPFIVHFTIALFATAVIFDLIGFFTHNESLKSAGWWNMLLATVAAIASVTTGLWAANTLPHNDEIHRIMETHELLGLIVLGLLIGLLIWRGFYRGSLPARLTGFFLLIGVIGVSVMMTGSFLGGEMVYRHGMGVTPVMADIRAEHDKAYACPMHAEVASVEPGFCSKCGMALVKIESDSLDATIESSPKDSTEGGESIHIHDDGKTHRHDH